MTIAPFGWHDNASPYITAVNLELMLGIAGTYTDAETARAESAEAGLAPKASPALTGIPTAPTASNGTNTTQLATSAFVATAVSSEVAGVATFDGRSGAVTPATGDYTVSQVTGAAPAASPTFTGTVTIPTPTTGDNTTKAASTAFVQTAVSGASAPVSSVFTRTGAVVAVSGDYSVAQVTGAAPLASPTFTGTVTVPTPTTGDNTTKAASTAYVTTTVAAGGSTRTPAINSITSSATPAITVASTDLFEITALAANITGFTLTGTPGDGQKLMVRIKDNGSAKTITWGSSFLSSGIATLLATTVATKTHMVGFVYDVNKTAFVCLAVDASGY